MGRAGGEGRGHQQVERAHAAVWRPWTQAEAGKCPSQGFSPSGELDDVHPAATPALRTS